MKKTGHKADPAQVVADMRTARNENGDRLFSRNKWLNATQIKGFFSRMTAKQRRQGRLNSDIVFSTEDVECLEYESERNAQIEEVFGQLLNTRSSIMSMIFANTTRTVKYHLLE